MVQKCQLHTVGWTRQAPSEGVSLLGASSKSLLGQAEAGRSRVAGEAPGGWGGPEVRVEVAVEQDAGASSKAPRALLAPVLVGAGPGVFPGPGLGAIRVNQCVRGGDYNQGPVVTSPTFL